MLASQTAFSSIEGVKKIEDRGEIRVAVNSNDFYPFHYKKRNGEMDGIDIKIAQNIAKELNVKLFLIEAGQKPDSVIELVSTNDADIGISYLSITIERSKKVYFTTPYLINRYAILLDNSQDGAFATEMNPAKMISLGSNIALGVVEGTSYVENVRTLFPKAKIVEFKNWNEAIRAISKKRIFGYIDDEFSLKQMLFSKPELLINYSAVPLENTRDSIAIAVSPQNSDLIQWLNIYLNERMVFLKNEDHDEINEYLRISKWIPGQKIKSNPEFGNSSLFSDRTEREEKEESNIKENLVLIMVSAFTILSIIVLFIITPKKDKKEYKHFTLT